MKRIKSFDLGKMTAYIALLVSFVLNISCSLEKPIDTELPQEKGSAKVKLHVMIPDLTPAPLASRASEISNMVVMTFGTTAPYYLKDTPQPCIIEFPDTPDESYFVATLNATSDPRLVVIVANASTALLSYTYTIDVTTLADVEAFKTLALTTAVIGGTTYITQQPEIACMEGRVTLPSILNGMIITDSSNPVPLTRGTAQIVIDSSPVPATDLEILGASLCNAPLRGFIFPQPTIATSGEAHHHYTSSNTSFLPFVGATSAQKSEPLYCYEDSKDNGLFVLLEANYKGIHGYYRINMVDGVLNDFDYNRHPIDIVRNTLYTVNIYKASNYGYTTIAEAINNRASNIEYTVTAYVPSSEQYEDAHDIISNGDYFLGVSNSAFVSYSSGATGVIATTLTHNATATVTTASISVSGTGLTLVSPSSGTFNPGDVTKKFNIEVSMTSTFTTGTITIVLGTITKVITVEQRAPIPFIAGVVEDFAIGNEHFTGMLIPVGGVKPNWLKFSSSADGSNGVEEINNLAGKIYIVHDHNIVNNSGSSRSGSVYITRDDDKGRVKALFVQPFLNADGVTDNTPGNVNGYVGAFWKANQTGERLIRIMRPNASSVMDGQWTAVVISGNSWIKLDKIPSSDAVWTSGGPSMSGNDPGFDAIHTVLGTATSVFGRVTSSAPNNEIYFRIGLRSTHLATLSDPARYGIVLIASAEGAILQRIWIRQGDDPDYLMRPTDGGAGAPWGSPDPRPNAIRFSPYNLTAATMNASVRNTYGVPPSADQLALFTEYPSQAGAYFQWATNPGTYIRYAWDPITPTISTWPQNTYPNGPTDYWQGGTSTNLYLLNEACPAGYTLSHGAMVNFRRFTDGATDAAMTSAVIGSEVSQSLFLNPTVSAALYDPGNKVWGYYADGFFDRREIVAAPVSGTSNAAVSITNNDIAYLGALYYNTNSGASLFFPAVGGRIFNGNLASMGGLARYWSSSSTAANLTLALNILAGGNIYMSSYSRDVGNAVRCVVDNFYASPSPIWLSPSSGNDAKTIDIISENGGWTLTGGQPANATISPTSGSAGTTPITVTRSNSVYGLSSFNLTNSVTGKILTVYVDNYYIDPDEELMIPNNLLTGNTASYNIYVEGGSEEFIIVSQSALWFTASIDAITGELVLTADQSPNQDPRDATITLAHANDPTYTVTYTVEQDLYTNIPPFRYFVIKFTWASGDFDIGVEFANNILPDVTPTQYVPFDNTPRYGGAGNQSRALGWSLASYVEPDGTRWGGNSPTNFSTTGTGSGMITYVVNDSDTLRLKQGLFFWGGDATGGQGETVFFNAPMVTPPSRKDDNTGWPRKLKLEAYAIRYNSSSNVDLSTPVSLTVEIATYEVGVMRQPTGTMTGVNGYNFYNVPSYINPPTFNNISQTLTSSWSTTAVVGVIKQGSAPTTFRTAFQHICSIEYDRYTRGANITWYPTPTPSPAPPMILPANAAIDVKKDADNQKPIEKKP